MPGIWPTCQLYAVGFLALPCILVCQFCQPSESGEGELGDSSGSEGSEGWDCVETSELKGDFETQIPLICRNPSGSVLPWSHAAEHAAEHHHAAAEHEAQHQPGPTRFEQCAHGIERIAEVLMVSCSMSFGFAVDEASDWHMYSFRKLDKSPVAITLLGGKIAHALGLSVCCCIAIFGLDTVHDRLKRGGGNIHRSNKVVGSMVSAIAICVGLSWEAVFDPSIEEVTKGFANPRLAGLFISAGVALVIVPAWKLYILKKALLLDKYQRTELKAKSQLEIASSRRLRLSDHACEH